MIKNNINYIFAATFLFLITRLYLTCRICDTTVIVHVLLDKFETAEEARSQKRKRSEGEKRGAVTYPSELRKLFRPGGRNVKQRKWDHMHYAEVANRETALIGDSRYGRSCDKKRHPYENSQHTCWNVERPWMQCQSSYHN